MYRNPQRQAAGRLSRSRRAGALALAGGAIGLLGLPGAAGATTVKVVQAGTPQVFEISTPGVEPDQITAGPDGSVWYTGTTTNGLTSEIGELTATDQQQYSARGSRRRTVQPTAWARSRRARTRTCGSRRPEEPCTGSPLASVTAGTGRSEA